MRRDRFGIEPVCAVLGFPCRRITTRETRAEPTAREIRDAILKDKIMEVWKGRKGREVYGARKVWLDESAGNSGGAVHGGAADA